MLSISSCTEHLELDAGLLLLLNTGLRYHLEAGLVEVLDERDGLCHRSSFLLISEHESILPMTSGSQCFRSLVNWTSIARQV